MVFYTKKTYINVSLLGIDIGFGFSIVYLYWTSTWHGYQNLGEFQNSYVNVGFVFSIV